MNLTQVLDHLNALADPKKIATKSRKFGINASTSLGVYHKDLKLIAKQIGQNNELALELYATGIYEAKILCSKIYDPRLITVSQMEAWVNSFENWEICDSFCMGFFAKSGHALEKAKEWSEADSEYVKRAGFVIMASYGFVDKQADNSVFERFYIPIEREMNDQRVYVKKAVNWALRNIGKRNVDLNTSAIDVAKRIAMAESKSAQWIGRNALAELNKPGVNILDYPRSIYRL